MDVAGPPPMPHERERVRRRRLLVMILVLFGAFAGSSVFWFGGESDRTDAQDERAAVEADSEDQTPDAAEPDLAPPDADAGTTPRDSAGRPDAVVPEDDQIPVPDLEGLAEDDRAIADLFVEIDASERVMMAFQYEVQRIFTTTTDPTLMFDAVRHAAQRSIADLGVLRGRLRDASSVAVRDAYVVHLDSWVDYLQAIEDNPERLAGDMARWTLLINATGDAFVRVTDDLLTDTVDPQVRAYAEAIVERGFSAEGTAQV